MEFAADQVGGVVETDDTPCGAVYDSIVGGVLGGEVEDFLCLLLGPVDVERDYFSAVGDFGEGDWVEWVVRTGDAQVSACPRRFGRDLIGDLLNGFVVVGWSGIGARSKK